jgi:glycosidase
MKNKIPILSILTIVIVFNSCINSENYYPDKSEITGLASAILLNPTQSKIILEDYFQNTDYIDSIALPNHLQGKLSEDKKEINISQVNESAPWIMVLKIWAKGTEYSILLKKSREIAFNFVFDPKGKVYKQVAIAGDMNAWDPGSGILELKNNTWQKTIYLAPGTYGYQLHLDQKPGLDPNNPDSIDNNIGGYNSALKVGDAITANKPHIFTKSFEKNNISVGVKNNVDDLFIFWENYEIAAEDIIRDDLHISFRIPNEAKKYKRSHIRIWACNKFGEANDLLIPLQNGKVINDPGLLSREDWEATVFYFLLVDRFNNGNPDNDEPVNDPEINPKANYFGGDLEGVIQKINDGYFEDLGINTIWLSPITQNPLGAYGLWPDPRTKFSGYHGYWPVSSTHIDYRFGNDQILEELITTAHKNNMNVVLDYVANHVHELHPVYRQHPDWATNLYLPDGTLNTEKWDEHRLTTWFDTFLPTLDLESPLVTEVMTDSALYWLTNFEIDGFRHDATKHIPEIFWRKLTKKIKQKVSVPKNKRMYQIGETYGTPKLIGSYVGSGMLDAQFDFNVYDDAINVLAKENESFERLSNSLLSSLQQYGYHNIMGYISGNQDRPRFISVAGGQVKFEEDTKLAGWTRKIDVGDPLGYQRLQMLQAFNMTIPGIPTIYYGDEYGMPGANDPDNRRMMQFNGLKEKEKETLENIKKLVKLRREKIQFTFGDMEILFVDGEKLIYSRSYFENTGIVIFNKSNDPQKISLNLDSRLSKLQLISNFGSDFIFENGKLEIFMEPNSFEVLTN